MRAEQLQLMLIKQAKIQIFKNLRCKTRRNQKRLTVYSLNTIFLTEKLNLQCSL